MFTKYVELNCEQCGIRFKRTLRSFRESKSKHLFCGLECHKDHRKGKPSKANFFTFRRAQKIHLECGCCRKKFTRSLVLYNASNQKNFFCSRKCFGVSCSNKAKIKNHEKAHFLKRFTSGGTKFSRKNVNLSDLIDIYNKQNGLCNISKMKLFCEENSGERRMDKISLDRIDSSKPYTKDNMQFVCLAVNYAKLDFSQEEAKEFFDKIRNQK